MRSPWTLTWSLHEEGNKELQRRTKGPRKHYVMHFAITDSNRSDKGRAVKIVEPNARCRSQILKVRETSRMKPEFSPLKINQQGEEKHLRWGEKSLPSTREQKPFNIFSRNAKVRLRSEQTSEL